MYLRVSPAGASLCCRRHTEGVEREATLDDTRLLTMFRTFSIWKKVLTKYPLDRLGAGNGVCQALGSVPVCHSRLQAHMTSGQLLYPDAADSQPPAVFPGKGTHLHDLHIRDFALVQEQRITFTGGLNVVTGESGAGKSILVQALGQVLGAPVNDDCIRSGADAAMIEGCFKISPALSVAVSRLLMDLGLPKKALRGSAGNDTLTEIRVKREVSASPSGTRSRCFINGAATSVRVLKELGRVLVDVNGQNSSQTIKDPSTQLALLDRIAGTMFLASRFSHKLKRQQELHRQLQDLSELGNDEERDRLQAFCDQVGALKLVRGEELRLRKLLRVMESRSVAVQQCSIISMSLSGEGAGLVDALQDVQSQLRQVMAQEQRNKDNLKESELCDDEDLDVTSNAQESESGVETLVAALGCLQHAQEMLWNAEVKVDSYAEKFQFDKAAHEEISSRLQAVEASMRDYDCSSTEQLLEKKEAVERKLDNWFQMEGNRKAWQQELMILSQELEAGACELSHLRRSAAGRLRAAVESCLRQLAMGSSRFDVRVCWEPEVQADSAMHISEARAAEVGEGRGPLYHVKPTGLDSVEFMLAAGPAEPLRPLSAVASGGESSRLMLALKTAPVELATGNIEGLDFSPDGVAEMSDPCSDGYLSIRNEDGKETLLNLQGDADGLFDSQTAVDVLKGQGAPMMILDELDSGVGGRLGSTVGQLLKRLVSSDASGAVSQVICVSHLPQVAAHAHHHIRVRKTTGDSGRTTTCFDVLQKPEERASEVADMLGAGVASPVAIELLCAAQGWSEDEFESTGSLSRGLQQHR